MHTQKIAIHFYYVFFHTKITMYYTQKITYKNVSVFPIQKLLCSAHTKNHIQKLPYKNLLCILTHKNCHTKMLVFFYTHKKYYVIHAKITSIFTIQKLLCSAPIQKLPYKRLPYIFPIQKLLCSARTKLPYIFTMYFLPYKNYYVLHAKNHIQKNVSVFPIQKFTM